jgi:hypothetical protein
MTTSVVAFHPLSIVAERNEVLVGRPDTDSYARFPPDGAALLQRLQEGNVPAQAAAWYETAYGQPVDMEDFLATLRDLGFVRDGATPQDREEAPAGRGAVRFQRIGRVAFSRPAAILFAGLVATCAVMMLRHPELRPRPGNLVFSPSLVVVQLGLLAFEILGVAWHETSHVLSGRRLGIPSRIRLGRRLYFLVVETSLDGLLGVPERRRYLPFLAGMLADVVAFSALTVAAGAGLPSWAAAVALAIAYLTLLRLAWQCYLFLRTDLYYVLATALGCNDLHAAAWGSLRNRFRALTGRAPFADAGAWSPRDRAVSRWYAPFALCGVAAITAVGVLGVLPALARLFAGAVHGLGAGGYGARFWDAAVFVAITGAQLGLVVFLAVRSSLSKGAQP